MAEKMNFKTPGSEDMVWCSRDPPVSYFEAQKHFPDPYKIEDEFQSYLDAKQVLSAPFILALPAAGI